VYKVKPENLNNEDQKKQNIERVLMLID